MIGSLNMANMTLGDWGFLQSAPAAAKESPPLDPAAVGTTRFNMTAGDARSFTARLIYERITIQVVSRTEAPPSAGGAFSPLDFSPEATAQRIFSFSISLFSVYEAQNSDESAETVLANFEQLVRDAIDEGFGEARNILGELGNLDAQTADFVDRTYSILDRLLDEFFGKETGGIEDSQSPGDLSGFFPASAEFTYEYYSLEAVFSAPNGMNGLSRALQNAGDAPGLQNAIANQQPANLVRFEAEILSLTLSYTQLARVAPEPSLQLLA